MRISKIAPSRHKDGRWLIWLEDGSLLRVGEAEMLDFSLHAGLELDDAAADRLLAAARKGRLREKALALLTARPMSRRELIDRLTACPRDREKPPLADEAQAAETADWLERLGLLNDAEYARTVVRHYSAKGYGPYKVRDELYRRGGGAGALGGCSGRDRRSVCGHRRLPAPEAQGRPDRPPGAEEGFRRLGPQGLPLVGHQRGAPPLGCGY